LTLEEIRTTLSKIVDVRSASDSNLYYMDGCLLFSGDDAAQLPDGLHPDAAGLELMGQRFAAIARNQTWLPKLNRN
jgi:lysophospholipase L1-like esterase